MADNDKKKESSIENRFFESAKNGNISEIKQLISQVDVNCKAEEGMTALMYAAYRGSEEVVEFLLQNGADPNIDSQKDLYTPLMFATLSGSTDTVRILLEAGAKPDALNKINRTASQLGAFVGRHDCVSVINNFVQTDQIKYYTQKHGLEDTPRLDTKLADSLHKMIVIPNMNPVKLVLFFQDHMGLIEHSEDVLYVLGMEVEKAFKDVNEVLAIKLHIFTCVLKKCVAWETNKEGKGGIKGFLKYLLKGRPEDGFLISLEGVLRDAVKSFPYAQSNLFQQMVKTLAPIQPGTGATAVAVITQSINGMQSADFSECCCCCGDRHCFDKCSACKMVRYCNASCQKLHWGAHKHQCKELRKVYDDNLRMQELEKERKKKEEEKEKANKEKLTEVEHEDESHCGGGCSHAHKDEDLSPKIEELNLNEEDPNSDKVSDISAETVTAT